MSGAIKSAFRVMAQARGPNRYGGCVITDGEWKVVVIVNRYPAEAELTSTDYERGNGVTVIGKVKVDGINL